MSKSVPMYTPSGVHLGWIEVHGAGECLCAAGTDPARLRVYEPERYYFGGVLRCDGCGAEVYEVRVMTLDPRDPEVRDVGSLRRWCSRWRRALREKLKREETAA